MVKYGWFLSALSSLPSAMELGPDTIATVAALATLLYLYIKRSRTGSFSRLPLPPGPKGLPIIGNLLNMPTNPEWVTYHQWAKDLSE